MLEAVGCDAVPNLLGPSLGDASDLAFITSRSLVLNRLRPATGAGKAQPISPVWRNRGYRCIGGALYRVSANKLSRAASRQGDVGCRTPLRTGESQGPTRLGASALRVWGQPSRPLIA